MNISHSRELVLEAYKSFLTACSITSRPRNRAYALGVLTGTLQNELRSLDRVYGYLYGAPCDTVTANHCQRIQQVLEACSKIYINNEV